MPLVNIKSEIGKLQAVILHRPGRELLNITPEIMADLMFDEMPYLDEAQKEHDNFAEILQKQGCKVYYLEDLAAESITDESIRQEFIDTYLQEADIAVPREMHLLQQYLYSLNNYDLVLKMMEGMRKNELPLYNKTTLVEMTEKRSFFVTEPMPNLYFTRDPFAFVGNGVSLNHMWSVTRRRETLFGRMIFRYHPLFRQENLPLWYDRHDGLSIEGGDIIVLSDKVVAVGVSQRTTAKGVMHLAHNLLTGGSGYETVLALTIPKSHAFMHLDTVFTMVDRDLFTLHPQVDETLEIYALTLRGKEIHTDFLGNDLQAVLKRYLHIPAVKLIREGKGTVMDAIREQWSDGYNTLAISPGEAVVYDRNVYTNEELDRYGVKLHVLRSGELSRGRGGPRCMSMPLSRLDLN